MSRSHNFYEDMPKREQRRIANVQIVVKGLQALPQIEQVDEPEPYELEIEHEDKKDYDFFIANYWNKDNR
jgi:hypothetical protein